MGDDANFCAVAFDAADLITLLESHRDNVVASPGLEVENSQRPDGTGHAAPCSGNIPGMQDATPSLR